MLNYEYIEQIRALGGKEAKLELGAYAEEFGVSLQRNKSFDNMLLDLENAEKMQPEETTGFTTSDLIDSVDEVEANVEEIQENEYQESQEDLVTDSEIIPEYVEPEPVAYSEPEYVDPDPVAYSEPEYFESEPVQTTGLPEGFVPKFNLIGNPGYYTLNWAIYDWITQNEDWKQKIHEARDVFQETLYTLLYYIEVEGSVTIRETRNSQWYTLT